MPSNDQLDQLRLDTNELVIEQTITDRRVGSIRKLIPIKSDGEPDPARQIQFIGQSQIMTPAGPLP
ncbi:MAG: hypothetical protein ACNA7J_05795, partial [Wenzhouxiangella sp.]